MHDYINKNEDIANKAIEAIETGNNLLHKEESTIKSRTSVNNLIILVSNTFILEFSYYVLIGDNRLLGELMNQSQQLFDNCAIPNCLSQLQSPKLHDVMSNENIKSLCYGIKGVGSQGDGSVQLLCENEEKQLHVS